MIRAMTRERFVTITLMVVGGTAPAPLRGQEADPPAAVARLEGLAGSWETDRVEFLDSDGNVVRVSGATAHNELQLEGRVLVHRGRLDEPSIETRAWYYWDPEDERLHMGAVSSSGRYDEFVGGWEGDRLVMTTLPKPAYDGCLFRMTHREITDRSYLESLEVSSDGGETWRVSSRQRMRRSDGAARGAASEILGAIDAYTGHWRSQERAGTEGRPFHFEYDLAWFDPDRTVAKLRITREGPGGTSVVFEGFKGLAPDGAGVYYVATSPSGRGASGEVVLDGPDLVTFYEGWSPDGSVVEIRDVFTPVAGDRFVSRTYLRSDPAAEWRRIGEDRWTRTAAGVPEEIQSRRHPDHRDRPTETRPIVRYRGS